MRVENTAARAASAQNIERDDDCQGERQNRAAADQNPPTILPHHTPRLTGLRVQPQIGCGNSRTIIANRGGAMTERGNTEENCICCSAAKR